MDNEETLEQIREVLDDLVGLGNARMQHRDEQLIKLEKLLSEYARSHGTVISDILKRLASLEDRTHITTEEVVALVNQTLEEFEVAHEKARRGEIRDEMGAALRDYFSWKRVSVFLVGVIGLIETTLRIASALDILGGR